MIQVKCTSVHLELLHKLLDIDWKHSIAAIIICWLTVCIILLLPLPELVMRTDVVMSMSRKDSYLHQASEISFPFFLLRVTH